MTEIRCSAVAEIGGACLHPQQGPLWVRSGRDALKFRCPLYPRKRTFARRDHMSALGHVWTAPSWQGLFSRVQHWSVQPCVRPVDAVHMTAGHNALRGSGPGQKRAFDDALAQVGCPDRRIDRLCITCCSPSQPFTSHRMPDAISFTPRAQLVPCIVRPWPSSPTPSWRSCWRARWLRPSWVAAPVTL